MQVCILSYWETLFENSLLSPGFTQLLSITVFVVVRVLDDKELCLWLTFKAYKHAHNSRIDVNFVIKVADFGLAESVGTGEYFRQDKSASVKLPLKWLAPESMEDYIFSEKSDVVCEHLWAEGA